MSSITNIFISYGRADSKAMAVRLRDDLRAVGYSVWFDQKEITGGSDWSQDIEDAIEQCHVMLALLSPASYNSQWCRAEQLRAIRKGKRLIPLRVVAGTDVPFHLEHINFLDFSDAQRYDEMFRDLLSDISASIAFQAPVTDKGQGGGGSPTGRNPYRRSRIKGRAGTSDEKRTSAAFRRIVRDLRQEDWLGARFWWPYFLFHFTDMTKLVDILRNEELPSAVGQGGDFNSRWDKFVRLHFRPRTPNLFHAEGFRSIVQPASANYAAMPAYLLFDLEAVVLHPEAIFADGNPDATKKTFKTPTYFRDLPFEQIYHDSWFMPDQKDEIMRYREAQVLLPDHIGLESLQLIWLRSPAEYETLHELMPAPLWQKWRDKICARSDYHLFNNKRPYVQQAILQKDSIRLRFNPCQQDCHPFSASAVIRYDDGEEKTWQQDAFLPENDLVIHLTKPAPYSLRFTLDNDLAYAGRSQADLVVI
jgi:hypothetical protein